MFVYCWEYSIVIINLLFESERLGFKSRLCTSMESWADPCFGEFQEPAHHRHWINSSYYQLVAQVSRPHIVPRVFLSMLLSMCSVSGFTAPITSQMAVSCLITFSLCPNRRAGLWLSLEGAVGGEWLFFTNSQQSQGTGKCRGSSPWWHWWPSQGNPPEASPSLFPAAAGHSWSSPWSSPQSVFSSPRVKPHLLPAWLGPVSRRDIPETLLLPSWSR